MTGDVVIHPRRERSRGFNKNLGEESVIGDNTGASIDRKKDVSGENRRRNNKK